MAMAMAWHGRAPYITHRGVKHDRVPAPPAVRRGTPLEHAASMMLTACGAASRHRTCRSPSHWSATAGPPAPLRTRRRVGAWVRPATPTAARLHAAASQRYCACGVFVAGRAEPSRRWATPATLTRLRDHAPRYLRHPRQRCNEAAEMQREAGAVVHAVHGSRIQRTIRAVQYARRTPRNMHAACTQHATRTRARCSTHARTHDRHQAAWGARGMPQGHS